MKRQEYSELLQKKRVAIYGRVSTDHESQVYAMGNQKQWLNDLLDKHPDWDLYKEYYDEGITGTLIKRRPNFLEMLEEAKKGEFDLIVTREVSRFARNIVDAIQCSRDLKEMGVEIYFVQENIWTIQQIDAEFRLSLFATFAQKESENISMRVKAGQAKSRDNGILYGNGNILGYSLKRNIDEAGKWSPFENTYVIDEEQAKTVRIIYKMCLAGEGYLRISKELTKLGRKDATGKVSWSPSKIGRILHNKTYCGYKCYNKSVTTDVLKHSRKKNLDKDSYLYIKGDWPAIVSEADWEKVQQLLAEKTKKIKNSRKCVGKPLSEDIWIRKLKCSCGSSFRRNKWRTNKLTGEEAFGYQCYNQVNNGAASTREKYGLSTEGYCSIRMIADWKLDFMAKIILQRLWTHRKETIDAVIEIIRANYVEDFNLQKEKNQQRQITEQIEKIEKRLKTYCIMRADGELDKEEYLKRKSEAEAESIELQEKLNIIIENSKNVSDIEAKLEIIRKELERQIDFSGPKVSGDILDRLVYQVIPMHNSQFKWILNLLGEEIPYYAGVFGRKNNPTFEGGLAKDLPFFRTSTGCNQQ